VSLYRQPGRTATRTLALIVAVTVIVAGGIGFAIGRSTAPDPSLAEQVSDLRSDLRPATQAFEFMPNEYRQAVSGGRVVRQAEYGGVRSSLDRAQSAIDKSRGDLRALNPEQAAAIDRNLAAVRAAVDRRADPAEVARLARAASDSVHQATGG
jgi:ATP-dependent exoDNAse (exonuclease V) alpha subunit